MAFPVVWPSSGGKGRLTEIASFRRSQIPDSRFQEVLADIMGKVARFPIANQNLYGHQVENPEVFVLVADWTSAEEKDVFEPDFQCHHVILPTSSSTTPEAGIYVVSRMRVATDQHKDVAHAFEGYARSLTEGEGYLFFVVGSSREDHEVVVCLAGFRAQDDVDRLASSPAHSKLKGELDRYVKEGVRYSVKLSKAF
ncbi:hypothetical protein H2200_004682 [Cladophialophora chaetospira]|uniref:ABM domain-containing protein n=1 Tax=Cladophialophora chaetospira TaxID=386627 RepID=A0AA38XDJ8_9EURO|nr:hypothetical protein H2200_004682 [Cladophialophora chaetospira]